MFVCGREEPLQINLQIGMLDEENNRIELSEYSDPRLYRYSFVWLGDDPRDTDQAFSSLVDTIHQQLQTSAFWLLIWRDPDTYLSNSRSRWILSKKLKDQWSIYKTGSFAIASKQINFQDDDCFKPPNYDWEDGHLLLFFGETPALEELSYGPPMPSIALLAQREPFAPSKEFLRWLAEQKLTIAYPAKDDFGRRALVIIGASKISLTHLEEVGLLQSIRDGATAGEVWQRSWSDGKV